MAQPATTPLFWPDKQGPTFNGVVPDADAARMPLEWNEAANKGIAWKTPLEDEGHSTPVIGGDLIWFTAATKDGKKNFVYCIDRKDGKILHHKLLFENVAPEELANPDQQLRRALLRAGGGRRLRHLRNLRHRAARSEDRGGRVAAARHPRAALPRARDRRR